MNPLARYEAIWRRLHHLPPIGYRVDWETKRFVPDPVYFPLVKQIFALAASGMKMGKLLEAVNVDWGFRTPRRGKLGGKPLARSKLYKMLADPFYAGYVVVDGVRHEGMHEPILP